MKKNKIKILRYFHNFDEFKYSLINVLLSTAFNCCTTSLPTYIVDFNNLIYDFLWYIIIKTFIILLYKILLYYCIGILC